MSSELYAVESSGTKTNMFWKIMIGPFAEHTLLLEKRLVTQGAQMISKAVGDLKGGIKHVKDLAETSVLQQSKLISLTVDGKLLVEATSEDFEADWESESSPAVGSEDSWVCKFRFLGERSIMFKVFETNGSGTALDSTDLVEGLKKHQMKICKACTVCVDDLTDLSTATLDIDGVNFHDLKPYAAPEAEPPISCDPQVLSMQYDILAPHKVRDVAPLAAIQERLRAGGAALSSLLKENWEKHQPGLQSFQGKLQESMEQLLKKGTNEQVPESKAAPSLPKGTFHL